MQSEVEAADAAAMSAAGALGVLFVYVVIGVIYAVIVFMVARKRGNNPWVWTIPSLIPVIGLIVAGIYMLLSFLSVLDRLNALERRTTFS